MKYLLAFYLIFVFLESTLIWFDIRKAGKIENILLWPVTKVLKGLNLGLRKINSYIKTP